MFQSYDRLRNEQLFNHNYAVSLPLYLLDIDWIFLLKIQQNRNFRDLWHDLSDSFKSSKNIEANDKELPQVLKL